MKVVLSAKNTNILLSVLVYFSHPWQLRTCWAICISVSFLDAAFRSKTRSSYSLRKRRWALLLLVDMQIMQYLAKVGRKNNISLLFATQNLILRKGTKLTERPWSRLLRPRPRGPSTGSSQTSGWSPFHLPTALTLRNVPWITIPYSFVAKHV